MSQIPSTETTSEELLLEISEIEDLRDSDDDSEEGDSESLLDTGSYFL